MMPSSPSSASPRISFVTSPAALRTTQRMARSCTDASARNGPAEAGQLARCSASGSSAVRTLHGKVTLSTDSVKHVTSETSISRANTCNGASALHGRCDRAFRDCGN